MNAIFGAPAEPVEEPSTPAPSPRLDRRGATGDAHSCRHSARKRPLKASMKALSVGLPGWEKSRVTP